MPVIAVATQHNLVEKTVSNIKEVIELSIISQKLNGNIDVLSAKAE